MRQNRYRLLNLTIMNGLYIFQYSLKGKVNTIKLNKVDDNTLSPSDISDNILVDKIAESFKRKYIKTLVKKTL